jgi:hypothetical protein
VEGDMQRRFSFIEAGYHFRFRFCFCFCFCVYFCLSVCFFSGCSSDKTVYNSPVELIQDGRIKDGAFALTKVPDDEGWALLGSLSSEMQDRVFRELINLALSHYSAGRYLESEHLLTWVEEHSGGDYEALKIAQAELFLLKGKVTECSEILVALVGVNDHVDGPDTALWSQPLKDFYAANIMKNTIGLNPLVETPGKREDIYIEEPVSLPQTLLTTGKQLPSGSISTASSGKTIPGTSSLIKRPRGLRHPFSGDRLSANRLGAIKENSYRGMEAKELLAIAGKPNRVISSSLPTDGLWKTIEKTERWDYVDKSGESGIAVVILNGVVKSIGSYERRLK